MLPRVLEPEVMDTAEEARDYDAMDHAAVNRVFVEDFLAFWDGGVPLLDVGTGSAQIPVELCRLSARACVEAVDLAERMLELARLNVGRAGFADRIRVEKADAKRLPYPDGHFGAVISNSIIHHIPEPFACLAEMHRVCSPNGVLFVRDLLRPNDEATLRHLVETYAAGANEHQRQMFGDSLHAALTLAEVRELVGRLTAFAGRAVPAALRALAHPGWWVRPFYGMVVGALPLALVTGVALGVVIWLHTRDVLARTGTGAVEFLPTFLAAAVLLELAPVGAGLIVAARTGASLGAELAAMKVGEQLDALELLGVSPLRRLVGPRVLACVLAVPVLHVLIASTAILSGFVAESAAGGTTVLKYQTAVMRELYLADVLPAALKTLAFGLVVGLTGCYVGLTAGEGSEGVGRAATDGVVACALLVLATDVFLVGLIKALFG